ncbi:YsnF/AvaK domain-containing protein [Azospirillum sp. SYSU D00513]|uniref:YsnF/AvaK domain-containing protein n=1 Tax=Azospirillum sp. SYSU D00513 TaxID=2812561 RepID=UPI001A970C5D|nr:YsnF/AvaK domain-containing protein [Azospirillum sp. SYSU D00513]
MDHKTIVALYDDLSAAQRVQEELDAAGIRNFTKMGGDTAGMTAGSAAGTTAGTMTDTAGGGRSDRVSLLTRMGVSSGDAELFAEGVRRGGVLVVGRVPDAEADRALDIIERHGPVDIDHRGSSYRESGWTGYDATAADYDETQATEERGRYAGAGMGLGAAASAMRGVNETTTERDSTVERQGLTASGVGEEHIPIVEEQLTVGKRTVERGGVRIRSYVVETPVEEQVRLRDETVTVERRTVDRSVGEIPENAFQERTIEVRETDEEAVVGKTARVREELVVRKDVEERVQTVSDTVRRTEVEIDDGRTTDRASTTGTGLGTGTTDPRKDV